MSSACEPTYVVVQVGQCGVQVGYQFFQHVFDGDGTSSPQMLELRRSFFRGDSKPIARSVLVDMEPKV